MDVLWFLSWYVIITITGWVAFPLAYRFFSRLPDRGYALSRALGWLVWGFLFWMLGSLGLLQNDLGGEILAFLLLAAVSVACFWGRRWAPNAGLWGWVREHRGYLLSAEAVFLVAFAALAVVRAANPEIDGTEKPMELAFINAILHSPTFPPHDPWLSGYSISYYYFGYVLVSMLIRLSGVAAGVGFNLAIALVFALAAVGAYGILYNLLALRRPDEETKGAPLGLPVLAPIFVLVMGNLEGILAMLHDKGFLWTQVNGVSQSGFWKWLGIQELSDPPVQPLSWLPHYSFIPWWRASRVLSDFTFNGTFKEVIDEFPAFSFLLSDLHPHVLTIPFAMLMIGLALNTWLLARSQAGSSLFGIHIPFDRTGFVLAALLLGSLGFLNTWDFPIYIALVAGAYVLGRAQARGWYWGLVGEFLGLGLALGVIGAVLYLPFYIGFSSQAGGILPSMVFFTRGAQFWVMFGTLLIPILAFLGYRLIRPKSGRPDFENGPLIAVGLVALLWIGMYGLGILASKLPTLGALFMGNLEASNASIGDVIRMSLLGSLTQNAGALPGRLTAPGAWISLTIILALILAAIIALRPGSPDPDVEPSQAIGIDGNAETHTSSRPDAFWLLLILLGTLLVLAPEFFYLRDSFGDRMNTIFKFYFAAWILWGIGAAYAMSVLLLELGKVWGFVWRIGALALLAVGLTFAGWGLWTKTGGFRPGGGMTLDGNAWLSQSMPDEVAANAWLDQQPPGVIAEAAGQSYHMETSTSATLSGYSTVLGWFFHEVQWHGDGFDLGSRANDLQTLYTTSDWSTANKIIQKYDIRYIVIGPAERAAYNQAGMQLNETKFMRNLPAPHKDGQMTIYVVPQASPLAAGAPWNGGVVR